MVGFNIDSSFQKLNTNKELRFQVLVSTRVLIKQQIQLYFIWILELPLYFFWNKWLSGWSGEMNERTQEQILKGPN